MPDVSSDPEKPPPLIQGVTGIILSGGKSSRFGLNKALADLNGLTLIEGVVKVISSVFHQTILIANDPEEYTHLHLPIYQDIIKNLGPAGGIYTGLDSISDSAGFFVACDMPFLNPDLIRYMVSRQSGFDAVVPRMGWKIESLHALYDRSCRPVLRENIEQGIYKLINLQSRVRTLYIEEQEIRRYDPDLRSFYNINRPQDLRKAGELANHDPFQIKRCDK